jgi:hypothetical protein
MRQLMTIALSAGLMVGAGFTASAEVKDVAGELVSIMCVAGNGDSGHGEGHSACALKCVKEGHPLGVMTSDGTIYKLKGTLTADHNTALQPLIAKNVIATGEIGEDADGKTLDASAVVPAEK